MTSSVPRTSIRSDESDEDMNARHLLHARDDQEQSRQVDAAVERLAVPESRLFRFPWKSVNRTVGPLVPGDVAMIAAASGNGKTEFVHNIAAAEVRAGRRVYLASLEVPTEATRLMFAARDCGKHPGTVLSFSDRPMTRASGADDWGLDVMAALQRQNLDLLRLAPYEVLDPKTIWEIGKTAAAVGADVGIIDHIDHVNESGGLSTVGMSVATTDALHRVAKRFGLVVIATSQLNVHGRAGDRFASYRPVQIEHIKYGGKKIEIASLVLGLFRPLDPNASAKDRKAVEDGSADDSTILEPNVVALNVLKSRSRGDAMGKRIKLRWDRGRILDLEPGL
jgi:hypothetical protein